MALADMLGEIERGIRPPPAAFTLTAWILEWIGERDVMKIVKPSTIVASRRRHDRYVRDSIGSMPLTEVRTVHIDRLYRSVIERGLWPATVRSLHALLHAAPRDAVRKQLLSFNPATNASLPPRECRKRTTWARE